jgi:hypothetical protein
MRGDRSRGDGSPAVGTPGMSRAVVVALRPDGQTTVGCAADVNDVHGVERS